MNSTCCRGLLDETLFVKHCWLHALAQYCTVVGPALYCTHCWLWRKRGLLVLQTSVKRGHLSTMMGSLLKTIVSAASHALLINFRDGSVIIYRRRVNRTPLLSPLKQRRAGRSQQILNRQKRANMVGKQIQKRQIEIQAKVQIEIQKERNETESQS